RRNGWPLVVAIGGDGTVHGVANGLLADGHTDVALGHVPAGNGNDYAKILGFGRRPLTTNLRAVLTGPTCRFDVGRV
ncbi:MAG: diacylglycerol kinase family lipid kinase, partial [Gammaproteobacteria bacterium]|nr:acylglycerol kinase family protein [Actinomycetota bacterium]NIU74817.1 diacylglycerol kinase family lipid kinase [Gammaproteobacteria bacterium]